MRRSSLPLWFALVGGLLGVQCLESLSDDCTKTLTCGTEPHATLGERCLWYFPDGGIWTGGPRRHPTSGRWVWPDGKETESQDYRCPGEGDAGLVDGGPVRPHCRDIVCDAPLVCDELSGDCMVCRVSTDCVGKSNASGPTPACDPGSHLCVPCLADLDCTTTTGTSQCRLHPTDPTLNACVECEEISDCATGEICNTASNECTVQCNGTVTDQCPTDKPVCNTTQGVCVQCRASTDCSGATPQCNLETSQCVQCTDDTACSATQQVCDVAANRCVQCLSSDQCGGSRPPYCDPIGKTCVECLDDLQCGSALASRCNLALHICATCNSNTQCETDAPLCRPGDGFCVDCLDNSGCAGNPLGELCNVPLGACIECTNNDQCTTATEARCDTTAGQCAPCNNNSQCEGKSGLGGLCSPAGACVSCIANDDCDDNVNASRCDTNLGECARCISNTDCSLFADTPVCTGGASARCVECIANPDCTGNSDGRNVCKTAVGGGDGIPAINSCVECTQNSDCRDPAASRCDLATNQCEPCTADGQCAGVVVGQTALNVCDTSGATGLCVQCTRTNRTACAGGANVCDSENRTCTNRPVGGTPLCQDCVSDAECAANARCVQQTFAGTVIDHFCVPLAAAGTPCGSQPYIDAEPTATMDSPNATVCLLQRTTCPALNAVGTTCTLDSQCGAESVADGLCVAFDSGLRCTVPCVSSLDCAAGSTCPSGGGACSL